MASASHEVLQLLKACFTHFLTRSDTIRHLCMSGSVLGVLPEGTSISLMHAHSPLEHIRLACSGMLLSKPSVIQMAAAHQKCREV
jgi:hypothetical protein